MFFDVQVPVAMI